MFEIDDAVMAHVKRTFTVPSRPEVLIGLQQHLQSGAPDINELAELISRDIGVAAGVLKVINSAAYGLARSVTDIKQAAKYLGLSAIHTLVTGLALKQSTDKNQCCIALDSFWDKATHVANVATYIARERLPSHLRQLFTPEDVYTTALFRDCGIPAMAVKFQDYNDVMAVAEKSDKWTLAEIEEHKYQSNHAVVGDFISSTWKLPRHICQQVLRHHDRQFLAEPEVNAEQVMFAVITLADNLVTRFHNCHDTVEFNHFSHAIFELLEMDEDDYCDLLEDIERVI